MPIKPVKGSLIKAGKQEDLTELMMDRISKEWEAGPCPSGGAHPFRNICKGSSLKIEEKIGQLCHSAEVFYRRKACIETPFRPSCCGTGKKKRFFAQLAHSAGPTCILYLAEEASDRLEFLPSWDSMDQDLLSLYGQYRSTLVDHMDVEKASDFDEFETSLFHFYLPSSYLCFVCSREEFDLFNLGIPPK
ncbi:hypothetical protein GOBAR_AA07249 [Gossypium barbadense]|uniref:Ribosomal protein L10 n=1 Tax=Gossypium barbadense TaxID=3634 RepID=A0A2P5YCS0_GOSBA|nr:hypothetical protein GOBAR_AA07249 [Gossypium barbadense]